MQFRTVAFAAAIMVLAGCGGGGGDSSTPPAPPTPTSFLVSTQAGTGGSVSPASTSVLQGNSTSFSVTTNTGFSIDNVSGCGGSLSGSTYTTGAITAACTVTASFKKLSFTVSASGSAGGTITPVLQQILYGDTATINVKADSGFVTSAVTGCNGQLQGEVYRTGAITADCKVEAVFAASSFQVTTQVSAGGKLSLQNPQVKFGETLQFTLLPDTGFDITTATGCGGKLSGAVFTTAPITAACTVEARFNPDHLVVFPDAQLDRVVRKALQLDASTPITKTQLAKLGMLYASSEGLTNLHGLQHAVGLHYLSVSYNQIVDITPLQELRLLNWLNLTENPIIDLKPLSNLLALEVLDIFYIPTTDLTPLAGLKLTSVGLSNQAAFDLSPLQNMPISRFSMWSSATTDISVLADAPLQFLHLHESKVKDLSVLKNLSGLERVFVTGTEVVDLSPLQQAKRLSVLDMINTSLQDLTVLETLNFGNEAYVSISGCIDQSGYSRHLEQLNALKSKFNLDLYIGAEKRKDCADTLAGTTLSLNAQVVDRTLQYNWQFSGLNHPGQCAVYLDLDDQQPGRPAAPLQACAASGSATFAGYQADQFRPALWFDNGVGGEKLVTIGEVGTAPASAKLQSLDLSQITISAKQKLVAERDGLLRLHVTAAQSPLLLPQFQLQLQLNGNTQLLTTAIPNKLPTSKIHRSLTDAYQAIIPANWMKAGLQITVLQDGQAVRSLTPQFAEPRPLAIRVVPIQLGDKVATLPDLTTIQATVKTFWPFSQVEVRARAPYQLKAGGDKSTAYVMLSELEDLRTIEGEGVYYYGYFKPEMGDGCCGGLGYVGYPVAVGFDTDGGDILAHELGHNFGREHVNCGNPSGPDPDYPYAPSSVGSVGLSLDLKKWYSPAEYHDVMSYCSPQHVSDYNVAAVQDFVLKNPPAAFPQAQQTQQQQLPSAKAARGFYLAGTLSGNTVQIRTLLPLSRAPVYSSSSSHLIKVLDGQGSWHQFNLQLLQIDHQPDNSSRDFRVELPEMTIQSFEIWQGDVLLAAPDNRSFSVGGNAAQQPLRSASQFQLAEKSNEICVNWPADQDVTVSLLYQLDGQDTVLALNETAGTFCRDSSALPSGGDWRLIWRQQLTVREFRQQR
jgi:Leucine-rich repeat (LRR) protein